MSEYLSRVEGDGNSSITIVTTHHYWSDLGSHDDQIRSYSYDSYDSIGECREALLEDRRRTGINHIWGCVASVLGVPVVGIGASVISTRSEASFPDMTQLLGWTAFFLGIGILETGHSLITKSGKAKSIMDSRIKAFNERFSELEPIRFRSRDYLSKGIKIPFRH